MDEALAKTGEWPNVALIPGTHTHAATGEHVEQPENTRIGRSRGACRPISAPSDSEPAGVENGAQNGLECDTREKLEADMERLIEDAMSYGWDQQPKIIAGAIDLLDRQAAITEREIYKREQFHEKTQNMVEQIETQGIEIDGLIAERDGLRRALETQEHLAGQASRDYLRVLDRTDELQNQVNSLTAERDELREKNRRQRKQLFELQNAIHERNEGTLKRQWKQQVEELKAEAMRNRDGVESLTAERDDLRSRLKTQADSFAKLERDNAQLRDKLERVRELAGGDAQ